MKKAFLLCAILLFIPQAGRASDIVFFEDFDEFPAPSSIKNVPSLSAFSLRTGAVDAFTDGGFALRCPSLGCLDLDGTNQSGATLVSKPFNVEKGQSYQLWLHMSGSQRYGSDVVRFGVVDGKERVAESHIQLDADTGFFFYPMLFKAQKTGTMAVFLDSDGNDNMGAILDSVAVFRAEASDVSTPNLERDVMDPIPISLMVIGGERIRYHRPFVVQLLFDDPYPSPMAHVTMTLLGRKQTIPVYSKDQDRRRFYSEPIVLSGPGDDQ